MSKGPTKGRLYKRFPTLIAQRGGKHPIDVAPLPLGVDHPDLVKKIENFCGFLGVNEDELKAAITEYCSALKNLREVSEKAVSVLGLKKEDLEKAFLKARGQNKRFDDSVFDFLEQRGYDREAGFFIVWITKHDIYKRKSDKLRKQYSYLQQAFNKGFLRTENLRRDVLLNPRFLAYNNSNIHLRCIFSSITKECVPIMNFFDGGGRSRMQIENDVLRHFRRVYHSTGKGVRPVQIMAEAGIISGLPKWCPAPYHPLRQRTRTQ